MVLQANEHTAWVAEHLVKETRDIDLVGEYATTPTCDVDSVNAIIEQYGERALIRGNVCCFDIFGQPGCWQDACCLVGTEKLILATYDDPRWVHALLSILQQRTIGFIRFFEADLELIQAFADEARRCVYAPAIP